MSSGSAGDGVIAITMDHTTTAPTIIAPITINIPGTIILVRVIMRHLPGPTERSNTACPDSDPTTPGPEHILVMTAIGTLAPSGTDVRPLTC